MKRIFLCIILLFFAVLSYGFDRIPCGIAFRTWGDANEDVAVTVTDAEGEEWTDYVFNLKTRVWQDQYMDFVNMEKVGEHKDGDGKIDFPLRDISIKPLNNRHTFGWCKVDAIKSVYAKEKDVTDEMKDMAIRNLTFDLETEFPGNFFYFGQKPKGKIVPVNCMIPSIKAKFTFEYLDPYGKPYTENTVFDYDSKENKVIYLPETKGCTLIKWTALFENGMTKSGQFSYGLIPDNSKIRAGKDSRFGINTHFNHGKDPYFAKIIKRIGFSWIRDSETNPNGFAVDVAKENDLQIFLTFSWLAHESRNYMLSQMKAGKKPYEVDLSPYIQAYGECAKKWGDYVDYYDILNEPNCNGWLDFGGTYNSGPWNEWNTEWSKQVTEVIRKNDPDCKIVWEDMHLERFPEILSAGARDELDYLSPHTYNFQRGNPLPEKAGYDKKYEKFKNYMYKYGTDWKLIIGEIGVSNFEITEKTGPVYTPASLSFAAAYLVRAIVINLSCPIEKLFWFKFEDQFPSKDDCEGNFGICYIDGTPKPIACAFANLINILESCEYTGRWDMGNKDVWIYGFNHRNGKKGIVCWTPEGETQVTVDTQAKNVKIIDLYGNEKTVTPKDGKLLLSLSENPFYVLGI